jgi:ADP-ribose pyrophosphatase
MKPEILSTMTEYHSPRIQVISANIELTPGETVNWSYANVGDGVAILPIDDQGLVYLSNEWRLAYRRKILQIPAGTCASELESGRIAQAHNELREETGFDAKKMKKLIVFCGLAGVNFQCHIYLATDLFPSYKKPDDGEYIELVKMPFQEAYDLFVNGKELTMSYTLIAFLLAKQQLDL